MTPVTASGGMVLTNVAVAALWLAALTTVGLAAFVGVAVLRWRKGRRT